MKSLAYYVVITNNYKYNFEYVINSINNIKDKFNITLFIITDNEKYFENYIMPNNINVEIRHTDKLNKKIINICKYTLYKKYLDESFDLICLSDSNIYIKNLDNIDIDKINVITKNEKFILCNINYINNYLNYITHIINNDFCRLIIHNDKHYSYEYISKYNNNINLLNENNIEIKENIKTLGIYYIATGAYNTGFEGFLKKINTFYPQFRKTIILLSDELSEYDNKIINGCKIEFHRICGYPWPIVTLFKMQYILEHKGDYDYCCYCNADVEFNENFNKYENIDLTRFTASKHNWMNDNFQSLPLHLDNPNSTSYIGDHVYDYANGCFFIGNAETFYRMCEDVINMMNVDIKNNIIPKWHDETYLNKWCFVNKDLAQTNIRLIFPRNPNNDGPCYLNYNAIKKPKYGE